jgi:hypothetical protein
MTNGWPAPASQELGANWVGVTARERVEGQFNQELKRLKRGQQQPVDFVPALLMSMPEFPGRRCFPELREGSRGRPAIR